MTVTVTIIRGEPKTVIRLPDGTETRCRNGIYSAARKLLAAGYDPNEPMAAVWWDGTPSLTPVPIGEFAKWSLSETDRGGLRRIKYRPYNPAQEAVE
jgi:hypothetical protein